MGKKEYDWWMSAPAWAEWHTWDFKGKTWWSTQPKIDVTGLVWEVEPLFIDPFGNFVMPEHDWYDKTPCPVEIDPATTLRKRYTQADFLADFDAARKLILDSTRREAEYYHRQAERIRYRTDKPAE